MILFADSIDSNIIDDGLKANIEGATDQKFFFDEISPRKFLT